MLTYFIFIVILYVSFEDEEKPNEHEIVYFNEFDISKNSYDNKVKKGCKKVFIMKFEKYYDLSQLTVRFKIKGTISDGLYMYLYTMKPENFAQLEDYFEYGELNKRLYLKDIDYNIYQHYFNYRTYENIKYAAFSIYPDSDTSFWTIFVFPLKIFNLTASNELNINSYYPNNTIPKNTCFYIRVIPDLIEANIQFKVPHNSEISFNLKANGVYTIPSDENIKKYDNYYLNANLLKINNNERYDNYIYNVKASSLNPYIIIYAELLNSLDYLSISIYNQESSEEKESDKQKESNEESSKKESSADNDSNSPVLVIIIIILSCIILIIVGYYLFKRFKKRSKANKPENNLYQIGVNPELNIIVLDQSNKEKD